jgi:hypothetical protein
MDAQRDATPKGKNDNELSASVYKNLLVYLIEVAFILFWRAMNDFNSNWFEEMSRVDRY